MKKYFKPNGEEYVPQFGDKLSVLGHDVISANEEFFCGSSTNIDLMNIYLKGISFNSFSELFMDDDNMDQGFRIHDRNIVEVIHLGGTIFKCVIHEDESFEEFLLRVAVDARLLIVES